MNLTEESSRSAKATDILERIDDGGCICDCDLSYTCVNAAAAHKIH